MEDQREKTMEADPSLILKEITQKQKDQLKSVTVHKDIDLEFDVGNLLAYDPNPLNIKRAKNVNDKFVKDLTRDNVQLLFNEMWKLPVERVQEAIVAKLPECTTVLPREKRIPKAAPLTKWQEYAKLKGIQKTKRGAMVWDETAKDWKPRFGYKRANDDTKDWVIEVPVNADPYEDQFEKRAKAKNERVAKNELQRLRNIARRSGKPMPGSGYLAGQNQSPNEKNEKPERNRGKKRKFDPVVGGIAGEQSRQLNILNEITGKQPKLNKDRAANILIHQENQSRSGGNPAVKKGKKQQYGNKKSSKKPPGKGRGGKRRK